MAKAAKPNPMKAAMAVLGAGKRKPAKMAKAQF